MFGNKGYGWKVAGALALIAVLGVSAAKRGDEINPALWRAYVHPEHWSGTTLWIPEARIGSVDAQGYEISRGEVQVRVLGTAPGPVGSRITLRAVYRGDPPRLEALNARLLPQSRLARTLMEIVSALVLVGVIANLIRHFSFRPQALQAAERTES